MPLRFDNRAFRALPIDAETSTAVREVANACFARVSPTPVEAPRFVATSAPALALLGASRDDTTPEVLGGCNVPDGAQTMAHCYCGHQFGNFAGQLGDGAAVYYGEVVAGGGTRHELQLKGAGPTPFRRAADGRKVLRSSLREFLCSEAMAGLGIPTTRAASLVTSDTRVDRDPQYNGRVVSERCSVVARVAETFLRFGSFEVALQRGHGSGRSGPSPNNSELVQQLHDFVMRAHFAQLVPEAAAEGEFRVTNAARPALCKQMLEETTKRTAALVASWQAVGFVHGVLNTDNMGITGLTIDYGPFGFIEHFDPDFIPNTSDDTGLYRYSNQPERCKWNCHRLAEALAIIEPDAERRSSLESDFKHVVDATFDSAFDGAMNALMARKLGLPPDPAVARDMRGKWFDLMAATSVDLTKAYIALEAVCEQLSAVAGDDATVVQDLEDSQRDEALVAGCVLFGAAIPTRAALKDTLSQRAFLSRSTMAPQQITALRNMCRDEPAKVEAMFGVDVAVFESQLDGEERKHARRAILRKRVEELDKVSDSEYVEQSIAAFGDFVRVYLAVHDHYLTSSADGVGVAAHFADALKSMNANNPRIVLRNWMAQKCIAAAEKGEYELTQRLVERLLHPFDADPLDDEEFIAPPPELADVCVSCSS